MSHERKIDVRGIWERRPSADIDETKRAQRTQRAPARAPLVSIGEIRESKVINIQHVSGLDLAMLLGDGPCAKGDAA